MSSPNHWSSNRSNARPRHSFNRRCSVLSWLWEYSTGCCTCNSSRTDRAVRSGRTSSLWVISPHTVSKGSVRFVAAFVDGLDHTAWAEMKIEIEGDPLGTPAYQLTALISVWLYGFMTGVRSSRKLEAACRDKIPYLWLTG